MPATEPATMKSLSQYLLPLAALLLALVGLAQYQWMNSETPPQSTEVTLPSIVGDGRPTLVEFGMNSCASCRTMHRILDELDATHGERLRIIRVNILEQSDLTRQWKIMAIPTQVFLDDAGQELYRHMGVLSARAIVEVFATRGVPLESVGDES